MKNVYVSMETLDSLEPDVREALKEITKKLGVALTTDKDSIENLSEPSIKEMEAQVKFIAEQLQDPLKAEGVKTLLGI